MAASSAFAIMAGEINAGVLYLHDYEWSRCVRQSAQEEKDAVPLKCAAAAELERRANELDCDLVCAAPETPARRMPLILCRPAMTKKYPDARAALQRHAPFETIGHAAIRFRCPASVRSVQNSQRGGALYGLGLLALLLCRRGSR